MKTEVLTLDQADAIHRTSLLLLERTGVLVPHADMLSRFADAGAKVNHAAQRVRIPAALVERALRTCAKSYTLYGRDLSKTARFGQGQRNFNSIAGEAQWIDHSGAQRRFATLPDVATAARFADALEHINLVGAMSDPHECDVAWRCVEVMSAQLRNTTKPVAFWYHDRASARFLNEMLIVLRGDARRAAQYPVCHPFLEPISPLRFPFQGVDLLYETAKLDLPVAIGPMAQMGLTAPMSIVGTLALENAEILAGICITQLVKEGLPVCYGGICHAFDMRTTQMIFCGPEQAIFGVAMTQIGKRYGLPVYVNVGLTDSKRPDAQAGLESGVTIALSAAAGADIFGHMGISGVDQAASLDMLTLQNEVISYVESAMRPIDCSPEALAADLVNELGPGATFIDTEHTVARLRQELWAPKLLDREYYQAWLDGGAKSCEDRCRERKETILATHRPEPVDPSLDKAIRDVVRAAKKELSGS